MTKSAVNKSKAKDSDGKDVAVGERKTTLLVIEDDENISTAISEYFRALVTR